MALALCAHGQTLQSENAQFGQGVFLASPPTSPLPRLAVSCVSIDPAKTQAQPAPSTLDRPNCAVLAAPVSAQNNRDFLNIARAGVSVSLGLTGDNQGFGLVRALASFSHFLDAGPLGGWQFRAEAQLARPPDLESVYFVDERVRLSLVAPTVAGWNLRFDTGAMAQGGLDPVTAAQRGMNASADVSRGFVLPGLGQEHRVHLRLTADRTQSPMAGTDQRSTRANLEYTHSIGLGSIGTDLATIRTESPGGGAAASTRVEVKFSRPF